MITEAPNLPFGASFLDSVFPGSYNECYIYNNLREDLYVTAIHFL